jgi:hypothetical protein
MDKTIVPTNFQSWPKIKVLIPDHKFIARELWCNQFVSACGVYSLDIDMFAVSLGFQTLNVEKAINDFVEKGLVDFDKETSEILICDWWRFHKCESPAQINIIQKSVDKIQSDRLKTAFFERIKHVSNKIKDLRLNNNTTETEQNSTEQQPQQPQQPQDSGVILKFPKSLDYRLIDEVSAILQNIPNAQYVIDEMAAALDEGQIKSGVVPWLKGVVKNEFFRTAGGFKKEEQRLRFQST